MAGRFPFDPRDPGQRQQQQQNQLTAQMRAALGLAGNGIEDALFLQQQQRQQDIQRDLRLRQMILQEQLEQQNKLVPMLHEHQLRAIGEHLQEYPDLQQHYQTLLLREQLQHHEERAILEAQAQMRYQEELRLQQQLQAHQQEPLTARAQAHAQALAEVQAHAEAQAQARDHSQIQAQAVPSNVSMLRDLAADSLAGNAVKKTENDRKRSALEDSGPSRSPLPTSGDDEVELTAVKRPAKDLSKEKTKKSKTRTSPKAKTKAASLPMSVSTGPAMATAAAPQMPLHTEEMQNLNHSPMITPKTSLEPAPKSSRGMNPDAALNSTALGDCATSYNGSPKPSLSSVATPMQAHFQSTFQTPRQTPTQASLQASLQAKPSANLHEVSPHGPPLRDPPTGSSTRFASDTLEAFRQASPAMSPAATIDPAEDQVFEIPIPRFGTLEGILAAAEMGNKEDSVLDMLRGLKEIVWPASEEESEAPEAPQQGHQPGEYVELANGFVSALPLLPEEPLYEGPIFVSEGETNESLLDDGAAAVANDGSEEDGNMEVDKAKAKTRTVSNVLEYPYPIDVWWPSTAGVRSERKAYGDESDEDAFEEEPALANEQPSLRANLPDIRKRLAKELRPGVLEKIPHCKIHRLLMRKKKNLSVPDLVFCWQVTDIYPNDTMVCCSMCGTWRHAACGGHHESFSTRTNIETPFVAVCDVCHEEEKILRDYPNAQKRLERQRMEQIRRGLATSSVMRHASFSKHGGTYKWPLGRVPAAQIAGHTRSANSRHDKAEKQWADMAKRLSNGYSYRPRERARVRTKELERLLVSVEDAESYTDRHNILLFLMRDTTRDHPVGLEKERRNIFDPEEDQLVEPADAEEKEEQRNADLGKVANTKLESNRKDQTEGLDGTEERMPSKKAPPQCARAGCTCEPRFDSRFCSDSCGVSALELDLLQSFKESSDIHPSVLRN